jgi:cysteinyl-tRNA synthetase
MIELISRLIERGHTYSAEGSVYFRISSFPEYGRLSRLDVTGIRAGARVDTDKYDKENARDFVLWKSKQDEPEWAQWDAPFGRGRPGWHIECSAMSMKYLGETFDIHSGGEDHLFPHHECEIAQSEAATGKPFARYWTHVRFLKVEGGAMHKSIGNVFLLSDLESWGFEPLAFRMLVLNNKYRQPIDFTREGLKAAGSRQAPRHRASRRRRRPRASRGSSSRADSNGRSKARTQHGERESSRPAALLNAPESS